MDKNVKNFISHVKKECKKNSVALTLSRARYVTAGDSRVNGYFDDGALELAVATGQREDGWVRVLLHEYAHMTQWAEHTKVWTDGQVGSVDSETIVDLWIGHHISLTPEQTRLMIRLSRDCELDCEKRATRLIARWRLPIDVKAYVKAANAYVYFWTYVGEARTWYDIGREPYNTKAVVDLMPDHFDNDYDKLPPGVRSLFDGITGKKQKE